MAQHRIFTTPFAKVYPMYVQKAERKKRAKEEVDQIICWLTSFDQTGLEKQIEQQNDFETFFAGAPGLHPNSSLIKGVVCGGRVENVEEPLMRKIRYLDRLIDELAKGKAMEKILRKWAQDENAHGRTQARTNDEGVSLLARCLTTGCSGRSAARPGAEPERWTERGLQRH